MTGRIFVAFRANYGISHLAQQEGITGQLKAENQMEWVARMNNIRNRADEIVLNELIFA